MQGIANDLVSGLFQIFLIGVVLATVALVTEMCRQNSTVLKSFKKVYVNSAMAYKCSTLNYILI